MYKRTFLLLLTVFLFFSCHSITGTREELAIGRSIVIFSFDDGPDEHTTPQLLDVLNRHGIKAMFFLLGVNAEKYPELVRRIHEEGHVIINHGYYDRPAYSMTDDEFIDNLIRAEEAISSAIGFDLHPKLYRPHGGFYKSSHARILQDKGYSIVKANIRVYDAVKTSANQKRVVNQIINKVIKDGGGIVLLHDARGAYSQKKIELDRNPEGPFNRLWIVGVVDEVIVSLVERGFILHHHDILAIAGFGD